MKHLKWVFLVITAVAAVAVASQHAFFQTAGTSSFGYVIDFNNVRKVQKSIQDYEMLVGYNPDSTQSLYLVDSRLKRAYSLDVDGLTGNLKFSARTGPNLQTELWKKEEPATSINYDHEFLLVTTGVEQCCGAMTGYRIYDVKSGYLILSFNSFSENPVVRHPFVLDVPNSQMPQRYIGVISGDSTRDTDFITPTSGMVKTALVKMGIVGQFYQRLQIDMQVAEGYAPSILSVTMEKNPAVPGSNSIEINNDVATLWNIDAGTDPAAVQGVQLKIVLNGGGGDRTVIIPVIKDRLSVEQATVPAGVALRAQAL
ncbi:hypothetical protein B9G69_014445 [Bdellovibrio sp. SKB1291214]|uniref:hypothetical protein n=1 Tax=Bdellovibrio sp. SKB1291214 TaxID=1732569 RepID=UPI000B519C90|nr:hypothetical protein [Bdellovibrio sp. SKB1291214]UYL08247.1 hypothetical protein B9G69_014445 [Bdellovibrio sp. SKB1291214]